MRPQGSAETLCLLDAPGWATVLVCWPKERDRFHDGLVVAYELHDPSSVTEEERAAALKGVAAEVAFWEGVEESKVDLAAQRMASGEPDLEQLEVDGYWASEDGVIPGVLYDPITQVHWIAREIEGGTLTQFGLTSTVPPTFLERLAFWRRPKPSEPASPGAHSSGLGAE